MENGRFVVKWNNGVWKAFDPVTFKDMEVFRLKIDAEEKVAHVNARTSNVSSKTK